MIPIDQLRPAQTTPTIKRMPTRFEKHARVRSHPDWIGWGLVVLVCAGSMAVAVSI